MDNDDEATFELLWQSAALFHYKTQQQTAKDEGQRGWILLRITDTAVATPGWMEWEAYIINPLSMVTLADGGVATDWTDIFYRSRHFSASACSSSASGRISLFTARVLRGICHTHIHT